MKSKRHAKILEIISQNAIDTQEELLKKLEEAGFKVTQATISRDIKELRLIKAQGSGGQYRYTAAVQSEFTNTSSKFNTIFIESVIHVDFAGNIVVVKCHTGMANAVCILMDSLHWEGVVGTLSGDDTIFILTRDENTAAQLADQYARMINR